MSMAWLVVSLVEALVEEGKMQHPMGPVEHKVLDHDAEVHLPQELEAS